MNRFTNCRRYAVLAVVALAAVAATAQAAEHAYVGIKGCKKCHIKQYKSWAETKMANAFELLKPGVQADEKKAADLDPDMDYTQDETCLACHTTGYGETGGFVDFESTPELAGVGCETCHGAGSTYTQNEYMSLKNKEYSRAEVVAAGMVEQIGMDQCSVCHNTDSPFVGDDYVFDFAAKKDEGTHESFPLKYEH